MSAFKIKDSIFVILITYLFFVTIVALNTSSTGYVSAIDIAFITALRFALPLLILIIPIEKIGSRIIIYTVAMFLLGFVYPLIQLSDAGGMSYLFTWICGVIIIVIFDFLTKSKYTQSGFIWAIMFTIIILCSIVLTYTALDRIKSKSEHYVELYVYEYLRCKGNEISPDKFQNLCNNLTSDFMQPYYQNLCFDEVKNLRNNGGISKSFQNCSSFIFYNKGWENTFSNYFMNYWNLKPQI